MQQNSTRFLLIYLPVIAAVIGFQVWFYWRQNRKWKARLEWREHPDPAAVEAQRQLYKDGEFRRQVLGWTPMDLHTDRGELSCGHYTVHSANDKEGRETEVDCWQCARDYLENARTAFQGRK